MKFTKTLAAITAAALAVSVAAIPASALKVNEVEQEVIEQAKTSTTVTKEDGSVDGSMIQIQTTATGGVWEFVETDKVSVTAAPADSSVDTSTWNLAFNAFTSEWGGWSAVQAEAGVLELSATIADIMAAIDCTDIANFGGFIFQVWNCPGEVEINWTIKVEAATAETPDDDTAGDDTSDDDNTVGDTEEAPGESTEAPEKEPAPAAKVEIANGGKTVIDSGLVRTNIINAWTGDDATVIAAKEAFAGANLVSVKFTVTGVTEAFDAWLSFADSSWACQFWGEGDEGNVGGTSTIVKIEKDGTYVITATLDQVIDAMEFIAVCTNLEAAEGDAIPTITIDEIMINEEIEAPTDPEVPGESGTNPPTGVTLVVVPAALAAAALATSGIVLKKRSK